VQEATGSRVEATALNVSDQAVQTCSRLSASTPRKQNLRKKLHAVREKARRRLKIVNRVQCRIMSKKLRKDNLCCDFKNIDSLIAASRLNPESKKFIRTQLQMAQVAPKGRRYSDDAKLFALSVFHQGPKAYRLLSSVFSLPSKSTLCLWMQSFKISAGFSDDLINATACRVKALSDRDRVYVC